jgi:hypothetical protein
MTHEKPAAEARFAIQLPGGRVARVPADVLLEYVEDGASVAHSAAVDDDDVTAHDMKPDPVTGVSDYHTDWEHGDCLYDDGSSGPQRIMAWHRHPFGTEYSEIFEG